VVERHLASMAYIGPPVLVRRPVALACRLPHRRDVAPRLTIHARHSRRDRNESSSRGVERAEALAETENHFMRPSKPRARAAQLLRLHHHRVREWTLEAPATLVQRPTLN
jgi:hypothetical protein